MQNILGIVDELDETFWVIMNCGPDPVTFEPKPINLDDMLDWCEKTFGTTTEEKICEPILRINPITFENEPVMVFDQPHDAVNKKWGYATGIFHFSSREHRDWFVLRWS